MFMRGHMEKRSQQALGGASEGKTYALRWKASAVVNDDSKQFAAELEQTLNDCSADGYVLAQIIPRPTDNGLVLVHQKHTLVQDPEAAAPAAGAN